tara:strand:+ start:88 stop:273 length:186 start_codon:yes stop_codon:yes gene_type:complete
MEKAIMELDLIRIQLSTLNSELQKINKKLTEKQAVKQDDLIVVDNYLKKLSDDINRIQNET